MSLVLDLVLGSQHVAADGFALHGLHIVVGAVVEQRHGHGLQCHVTFLGEGQVLRREDVGALAKTVQLDGLGVGYSHQCVQHTHLATCQVYHVGGRRRHVIVPVILFLG